MIVKGNKVHLCNSCAFIYSTCPTSPFEVLFGDGEGNYNSAHNICACMYYRPDPKMEKLREEIEATDNAMFTRGDILDRIRRFM